MTKKNRENKLFCKDKGFLAMSYMSWCCTGSFQSGWIVNVVMTLLSLNSVDRFLKTIFFWLPNTFWVLCVSVPGASMLKHLILLDFTTLNTPCFWLTACQYESKFNVFWVILPYHVGSLYAEDKFPTGQGALTDGESIISAYNSCIMWACHFVYPYADPVRSTVKQTPSRWSCETLTCLYAISGSC